MQSDRWGEHRGRYWLDAARYADSHGIHFDNYREIWAYRDWVISAFNRNLPFDQFTIEQLAGDLLPNPTLDQRIATGFHRCNITTNEGGVIAEEYAVLYSRDRTETTSWVWFGLTMNCATCHDHKFDSISQREFYEMSAFFNNTAQAVMDGNIKDTPPVLTVAAAGGSGAVGGHRAGDRGGEEAGRRSPQHGSRGLRSLAVGGQARRVGRGRSGGGLDVSRTLDRRRGRPCGRDDRRPSEIVAAAGGRRVRRRPRRRGRLQGQSRRDHRSARSRRFREGPGVFLRRVDQAGQDRRQRRRGGSHGRSARLSRLGPVARKRPARHAYHQQMGGRRAEGRGQRTAEGRTMEPRAGHLRRLRQGGRRESLRQRPAAGRARVEGSAEEHDPYHRAAENRPAEHAVAAGRPRPSRPADLRPHPYGAGSRADRDRHAGGLSGDQARRSAERCREGRTVRLVAEREGSSCFGTPPPSWPRSSRNRTRSKAAARSPTCSRNATSRRRPTCCSAASTTNAATRSSPTRRTSCRPCRRSCPRTGWVSPNGCCGRSNR